MEKPKSPGELQVLLRDRPLLGVISGLGGSTEGGAHERQRKDLVPTGRRLLGGGGGFASLSR